MATINFVVSGNRIATESFAIGKIYEIIFTNGNSLICACNHVGNNFVVFQRELPELLFTLNMETASSVRSIEETGGGGGTYNYNNLENKPQINSVELSGNKSSSDLGLQSALDTSQLDAVNSGITAAKVTNFEGKQDAITSDNKLSADLVDDATATNKFVTAADKAAWNAKQNALTASQLDAVNSGITAAKVTAFEGKQDAITSNSKLSADLVDDATTTNKFVTAADKTAWNAKQNALTASQLDAVNSGIDSTKVEQIETNKNNISKDEAALVELVDGGAKNIFDISIFKNSGALIDGPYTNNGVTYTLNSDGTISLSGTAASTSTCSFVLFNANSLDLAKFAGKELSGGLSKRVYIAIEMTASPYTQLAASRGDAQKIGVPDSTKQYLFYIRISSGENVDGKIISPMICTAEDYAISPAFVPYRPSYQELYEMVKALQANPIKR